jgi:hypothetical protein
MCEHHVLYHTMQLQLQVNLLQDADLLRMLLCVAAIANVPMLILYLRCIALA